MRVCVCVCVGGGGGGGTSARARAERGVSSDGLRTVAHPAARAAAVFRAAMATGKFQGVIKAATPTGSRVSNTLRPLMGGARTSPSSLLTCSENHSKKDAAYATSPMAS